MHSRRLTKEHKRRGEYMIRTLVWPSIRRPMKWRRETRNLAEGIVKEIARCFSLDGYISALTAQRLAASFVEMQPDKDGEKDEDGGDDGGEDGLIDWEPEE